MNVIKQSNVLLAIMANRAQAASVAMFFGMGIAFVRVISTKIITEIARINLWELKVLKIRKKILIF